MTLLAVALVVFAACGYAVGARLQHNAVHAAIGERGLGFRDQLRLVRNARWLLGLASLGGGALLHAYALGFAPLSVVQPTGVLALPITVLLNMRQRGIGASGLNRTAVLGVVASTGGVMAFVLLAAGTATATTVSDQAATTSIQLVTVFVLALGLVGLFTKGKVRCIALATGCAVAYGLVSVLVRAVSQQVTSWDLAAIELRPFIGIGVAVLVGGWMLQHAYAHGPPDLVVACLTVIDPMVAVGLGIGLLGEADEVGIWTAAGESLCAVVACAGVFALARYHPETQDRRARSTVTGSAELAGSSPTDRP